MSCSSVLIVRDTVLLLVVAYLLSETPSLLLVVAYLLSETPSLLKNYQVYCFLLQVTAFTGI